MIDSKRLLMTLSKLIRQYYNEDKHLPAFLKMGKTADNFHRFEKHFSFSQTDMNYQSSNEA